MTPIGAPSHVGRTGRDERAAPGLTGGTAASIRHLQTPSRRGGALMSSGATSDTTDGVESVVAHEDVSAPDRRDVRRGSPSWRVPSRRRTSAPRTARTPYFTPTTTLAFVVPPDCSLPPASAVNACRYFLAF